MVRAFVLFPGSTSSPYVPLRLVYIQDLPGLRRQGWIDLEKAVGHIFMCGRNYFERFLYLPLLPDLQSGSFHPVTGRLVASGKYPHLRHHPLQSAL